MWRDVSVSLRGVNKVCLKHGLSFGSYLKLRLMGESNLPPLSDWIRAVAICGVMRSYKIRNTLVFFVDR